MKRPSAEHATAWYVACLVSIVLIEVGNVWSRQGVYVKTVDYQADLRAQDARARRLEAMVFPPPTPERQKYTVPLLKRLFRK